MDRFDVDDLDEDWPFEIDRQASHLFKHPGLSLDDIGDVWASEPLFYPAKPPAHWLMVRRGFRTRPDCSIGAVEHRRPPQMPSDRVLRRC